MRYGIDVSRFQDGSGARSAIDYQTAKNALEWFSEGLQPFVMINSASPYYAQDLAGFVAVGAAVGVYFFADPSQDPISSEQAFRAAVGGVPAALDLETMSAAGWAETALWGQEWLAQPSETRTLLYSNLNFLVNMGGGGWRHPIWFAGTATPPANTWIWQYTQLAIPGIPTLVDINKWVGTDAQFATFFGIAVTQPPPAPKPTPGLPVRKRPWWQFWGGRL